MKRGRLANSPHPSWWIDWRCLVKDVGFTMKMIARIIEDTTLFDYAIGRLPLDKRVLHWFAKNHQVAFQVLVIGAQTGCLDQLLYKRLRAEWVQDVLYMDDFQEVLDGMREQPWVLGMLTEDSNLIDESKRVFKFEGPGMSLNRLHVFEARD